MNANREVVEEIVRKSLEVIVFRELQTRIVEILLSFIAKHTDGADFFLKNEAAPILNVILVECWFDLLGVLKNDVECWFDRLEILQRDLENDRCKK